MHVRKAEPRDYPDFVRLFPELAIDDPIPTREVFENEMMSTMLMAEEGTAVVGLANYYALSGTAHVRIVITAREARRRGVGVALMTATRDVVRAAGCKVWALNVRPDNVAAIGLYEKMGMTPVHRSHSFRIPWAAVDAMPASPPSTPTPRAIRSEEDARIEADLAIPSGLLALRRGQSGRVLYAIEEDGRVRAACAFDPGFPGAQPFRAERGDLALALLRALRPHGKHDFLFVSTEGQPDIAQTLLAHGAILRFEMLYMRGPVEG
jgi:GNAT superfamily N-acetyltransferase